MASLRVLALVAVSALFCATAEAQYGYGYGGYAATPYGGYTYGGFSGGGYGLQPAPYRAYYQPLTGDIAIGVPTHYRGVTYMHDLSGNTGGYGYLGVRSARGRYGYLHSLRPAGR